MHIFPPELEIGPNDGFDPKKDILNRAELGKGLTNLMMSVSDPLVVAVDGPWGCGKITFLKMWSGELRKEGFPVVYFDAFANDYSEDAFTAIASEIIGLVEDRKKLNASKAKKFVKSATEAGKILLRSSIKVGIKVGTLGTLNNADLSEFAEAVAGEASDVTDKYLGELLTKQNKRKLTIQAFRDALGELPELLDPPKMKGADQDLPVVKPLIFIVDELDRCRPLFALETLERIKHFFSVPNVHFVLGTHLAQLQNSVAVTYGPQIDAHTYLEKFIHLTFMLVGRSERRGEQVTAAYVDHLVSAFEFKGYDHRTVELCAEMIKDIAARRDFGLRTL